MRWTLLLTAASAATVSAAAVKPSPTFAVNLPAAAFPTFHPISLADIKAGLLDEITTALGLNHTATATDDVPDVSLNRVAEVPDVDLKSAVTVSCTSPPQRVEWSLYPTADRIVFINSIKCLMNKAPSGKFSPSKSAYEDFVRLHQLYMSKVHNNDLFLIWHRYYLWAFEQTLQRDCGLKKPMPWWDETMWAGRFSQSDLFSDSRYFGQIFGDSAGNPRCVATGAFSNLVCNIGPGNSNTAHCLSRAGNAQTTGQVTTNFVNQCNSYTSFKDMASCSQYGPHAYGHNGFGGVMSDVSASPSDPIFWMHHSFVDHSFRIWQNLGGATRVQNVNGVDSANKALSMSYTLDIGGISGFPSIKISDVMNTQSGSVLNGRNFCYRYNR